MILSVILGIFLSGIIGCVMNLIMCLLALHELSWNMDTAEWDNEREHFYNADGYEVCEYMDMLDWIYPTGELFEGDNYNE